MQVLYKSEWPQLHHFRGSWNHEVISWSRRNVIAFALGKEEILVENSSTFKESSFNYFIYIVDPNYPWEVHRIHTGYVYPVEHLRWDSSGTLLLSCDIQGLCKVWKTSETLFDRFEMKQELNYNCKIICVGWLGLETSHTFDFPSAGTAKDMLDKFPQRIRNVPLVDIGGQVVEGIFAVTFLGQVFLTTFGTEQQRASINLGNSSIFTHGDLTVTENGKVAVVLADTERCVQAFNVVIKRVSGKITMSVENQPCVVPSKLVDDLSLPFEITKVAFPSPCSSETVLVCFRNPCGSVLKYFDLCKERISMHPRYQRSVQHLNQLPTVYVWDCSKVMTVGPAIDCLAMPRLLSTPHDPNRNTGHFTCLTTVANGNKVARVALPTLVQLDDCNLDLGIAGESIKAICHSPLDILCAFVTSKGNFGILLLKRFSELEERVSLKLATQLIQYSLVTGLPSWEIAVGVRYYSVSFADRCLSYLREELTDQKNNQELMFLELLQLEANFYQTMKDGYILVFECYNALIFKAVRTYIHNVVDGLTHEKDQNLLSRISSALEKQGESQISKIAQSIDCSEWMENIKVISEIHFLLQWITEYAMHFVRLAVTVDFKASFSQLSCFGNGTLMELQEMLVLIYIWGQRFPSWQPNVVTLGNPLEVLSQIFRMIFKLQSICNGENVTTSLEDIPLKSLQIMYTDIPGFDPTCSVLSILQHGMSQPCNRFEFVDQEEINRLSKQGYLGHPLTVGLALNEVKGALFYDGINCDVLRLRAGESLKQCTRCRLLTIHDCDSNRSVNTSWMGRWKRGCVCGGAWKFVGS